MTLSQSEQGTTIMKQASTAIISGMLIALGLIPGGSQLRAQSEEIATGPINLTVALTGSSTISIGEPILLKYVVNNTGGQKANVFTEDVKQNPLITERFTDAAGKMLVPSVNPIPPRRIVNGFIVSSGLNLTDLEGNTSTSWEAVANAYVTFPRPGRYVLRVHVDNPYIIGDDDQGPRQILTGDYVFPLNVVAARPAYLRATAERLRLRVLPTLDVKARAMLIKALFSMPEDAASASWQALVEDPKMDGSSLRQIGTALARIHTSRAADILAKMVWESTQPRDVLDEASPSQHLYEMYDTGDAALRKHIEDLHKDHGVGMSHYRTM